MSSTLSVLHVTQLQPHHILDNICNVTSYSHYCLFFSSQLIVVAILNWVGAEDQSVKRRESKMKFMKVVLKFVS